MYFRIISSWCTPTLSEKYPSLQNESHQRNSWSSGNSWRSTFEVPHFKICTICEMLLFGETWRRRWTWSDWMESSCICYLFTSQAWWRSASNLFTTFPSRTRCLYLGTKTRWYCSLCFVCAPFQYFDSWFIRISVHKDASYTNTTSTHNWVQVVFV